jgi:hypothetical protein
LEWAGISADNPGQVLSSRLKVGGWWARPKKFRVERLARQSACLARKACCSLCAENLRRTGDSCFAFGSTAFFPISSPA